jgi:hypothetical protein
MSPYGFRSSSVRIGTKLGASPMARSDAIIPMYQMIHIAPSPQTEPTALRVPAPELSTPRAVELGFVALGQAEKLTM